MKIKQLLPGIFIMSCAAVVLFSAGCHSNDYDTSDTKQTTVSPSHDMHMTPPGTDHSLMDTSHMMKDSGMMHDNMMRDTMMHH